MEPSTDLHRRLEALLGTLVEGPELDEAQRHELVVRGERARGLALAQDWEAAAAVLLEAAELERRATGERGEWWALWLDVHDALVAGELGDWSV